MRNPVFADLSLDPGFKAVFCDPKDHTNLILLLNTFLPEGVKIKTITEFKDRELDGVTIEEKRAHLDLHCVSEDGTDFIVEMQGSALRNNYKRFVFYCARTFCSNCKKGDIFYDSLRPAYLVAFIGEDFLEDELKADEDLVSYISIINRKSDKRTPNTLNWIFVRLYLAKERYEDCETDKERCVWILKNLGQLDKCPDSMEESKYKGFAESAEIANFAADKKDKYDAEMKSLEYIEMPQQTKYELGREEGREEGILVGEERGRGQERLQIAKSLLSAGVDPSIISQTTGLPIERVRGL